MASSLSLLRNLEYKELEKIRCDGSVLDLGGSRTSGYHELVQGKPVWTVVNFGDTHPGADLVFDIEKPFPLSDDAFDHVLSMNVLEHIFEYQNVFKETARVLKPGGLFISSVPFMHHIHGSPDDYHRYTESTYKKLAEKFNFELVYITPLGYGLCSLLFNLMGGKIPTRFLRLGFLRGSVFIDSLLLRVSAYRRFCSTIPLGYFWVMKKPLSANS